jgi:hypothetical protein
MEEKTFNEWIKKNGSKDVSVKVQYFEYFIYTIIKRSESLESLKGFGTLKCESLLFFLVSAQPKLLKIFDNFYAVPWGIIEMDIHEYIKENKGEFSFFKIDRFGITLTAHPELQPTNTNKENKR